MKVLESKLDEAFIVLKFTWYLNKYNLKEFKMDLLPSTWRLWVYNTLLGPLFQKPEIVPN